MLFQFYAQRQNLIYINVTLHRRYRPRAMPLLTNTPINVKHYTLHRARISDIESDIPINRANKEKVNARTNDNNWSYATARAVQCRESAQVYRYASPAVRAGNMQVHYICMYTSSG